MTLWAVGGAPRDLVMGEQINDLDLAIDGAAAPFVKALAAWLPDATVGPVSAFGTTGMTLTTPDGPARLDLARLRSETYDHPGALPSVRWTHDVELDLARRDYSVNAIALGLTGEHRGRVVDPFEGIADAHARRLRALHPRSFEDDATRLWRGARVAASRRLRPDTETASQIRDGAQWAGCISGDRWFGELDLTARRGHTAGVVRLLDRWGVLRAIDPAWSLDQPTLRALSRHPESMSAPVFAALLLAPLAGREAVLARLSASRDVREAARDAARLLAVPIPPSVDDLAGLERTGDAARTAAGWLRPRGAGLSRAMARWGRTKPVLSADEVRALGVPRGPHLGWVLHELRRARYERTLTSRAAEREAVRRYVEREGLR